MKYDKKMRDDLTRQGAPSRRAPVSRGQAQRPSAGKKAEREDDLPEFVQRRSPAREKDRREQIIRDNTKKRKRRHKKNYILYYILLLIIVVVTGVVLSLTVFFNVETIEVEGNGNIPESEILSACGVKIGDNLLRTNTDRAANSILRQYVNLDEVTVSRQFPSTLSIRLTLSKVMATVRDNEKYYSLSYGGRIIGIDDSNPEPEALQVVGCDYSDAVLGSYLVNQEENKLEVLKAVVGAIEENDLQDDIQYADLSDITTIRLYYNDRIEIKLGGITDIGYELSRVKGVIEQKVGAGEIVSIDATLRNGAYYILPLETLELPKEEAEPAPPSGVITDTPDAPDAGSSAMGNSAPDTSDNPLSSEPPEGNLQP